MTVTIKQVKLWTKKWNRDGSTELRIYIEWEEDGKLHSGCLYKTGNPYEPQGKMEDLPTEVLAEAQRIAVWPNENGVNIWHTVYDCSARYEALAATEAATNAGDESDENEPEPAQVQVQVQEMPGRQVTSDDNERASSTKREPGSWWQARDGSWWIVESVTDFYVTDFYGDVERVWLHTVRQPTAREMERRLAWEALPEEEKRRREGEFWNEFFERTQYLS